MRLDYFHMITTVDEVDIGARTVRCTSKLPKNSTIFDGHFEGMPLLPGTLMIEIMAQAGGALIFALQKGERLPMLVQVDRAKVRGLVPPSSELVSKARILHDGSGFMVAECSLDRAGRAVAEAEIRYRTVPFPNDTVRASMARLAKQYRVPT